MNYTLIVTQLDGTTSNQDSDDLKMLIKIKRSAERYLGVNAVIVPNRYM